MEETEKKEIKPIIFWEGFPACGLLVKKVADTFGDDIIILATRATVPFSGIEEKLGHRIIWIDDANDIGKRKEEFHDRNFIIHTGWRYRGWLKYDQKMKKYNNAKVVVAVDNRYRGDLRQYAGALWFRLCLKKYFDAALVPGKSGEKLMQFLGMDPSRIYTGLYGAYEGIFKETVPIEKRNKEFLFVGQLNERKSVDVLITAFKKYRQRGGTWNLRLIGDGPLKDICQGEGIIVEGFAQPDIIAQKMNNAKVFVLPSRDDNWGTVVCEAAACGMHVIAAKTVGASEDIIRKEINGTVINSPAELEKIFSLFENMSEDMLKEGSKISKEIAGNYDSNAYWKTFLKMTEEL
jgi:glycosyltransferase involved in cell wall biosynthesis